MIDLRPTIVPKSDQLNADDLIGVSKTIKITKVSLCADPAQPIAIHFEGDCGKPYKPGKSMRRVLINVWGDDGSVFVGRRLILFRDEKVQFGGYAVGGIRISHMSNIGDKDVVMALTMSKASRKPYTVKPLPNEDGSPSRTTLADRIMAFKDAVLAALTVDERRALRKRAAKLFTDIDADQSDDFVTTSQGLDKWFATQVGDAAEAEKAPLARNDRIQADEDDSKSGEIANPKPEGPQPPKARDEINGPAPRDVMYMLAGDPVSDAGRVPTYKNGEKHSTCAAKGAAELARYTMHPTTPKAADDGPLPADGEDDGFPGDRPALTGNFDADRAAVDAAIEQVAAEWEPLERHEGSAPRGVEYTLASDTDIGEDDRVQAYENGEPTRRVALRDFVTLPEYEAHPEPLVEADEPPEGSFLDSLLAETTWEGVKKQLPAKYKEMTDAGLDWDAQEGARRQIWASVVVGHLRDKLKIEVKPSADISCYHIWRATQAGPEGAAIIKDVFAQVEATAAFKAMPKEQQERIRGITDATCKAIGG